MVTPGAEPAPGSASIGTARTAGDAISVTRSFARARERARRHGHHAPERDAFDVAVDEGQRRLLQRVEHEPAGTERPRQWVLTAALDQIGPPAMMPAWGPPKSLSPLNVTSAAPASRVCTAAGSSASHAGGPPFSHGHVASISPLPMSTTTGTGRVASSATDVCFDEPVDAVVARVHLQHDRRVDVGPGDGVRVVGEPSAVGGADVDESGTGLRDHLGHPERPADLDALATAHRHIAACGQRRDHEQDGGGVVVDDHRRLSATQPGQQSADRRLSGPPLSRRQVELDRLRTLRR